MTHLNSRSRSDGGDATSTVKAEVILLLLPWPTFRLIWRDAKFIYLPKCWY